MGGLQRIGWGRRVGIALAVLLVGGSLALAGSTALDGGGAPSGPAGETPSLVPPAPRLAPLTQTLLARPDVDVAVELPADLGRRGDYRLRIYVNGVLANESRLPEDTTAIVEGVPLEQGPNQITAALQGPGGESLHSTALLVERDDVAPTIHITAPDPGRPLYVEQAWLRGRSEPLAELSLRNSATGEEVEAEADPAGRWEVRLGLAMGRNLITLRAGDQAGNRKRASIELERVQSRAEVSLETHPGEIELGDLPASLRLVARVRGLRGEPLDGAAVTFSLSVPGQQTLTYSTTSSAGSASWSGIRVPRDGARAGQALATVMVVLDDGQGDLLSLQESASIRFR